MKIANLLNQSDRAYLEENVALSPFFGSIIHDFERVLEYIGPNGVPVSPKTSEFAIATLPEINACLAEPGRIGLARGRQVSYPHANGLHMLLRTSRMGKIDRGNTKPRMIIDPIRLERWHTLNRTERYFALLEAWWSFLPMEGSQRMFLPAHAVGYRNGLLKHLTLKGMCPQESPRLLDPYFNLLGMSEIALMQMFGMLHIHQGKTVPGEGWQIRRMAATRWGMITCGSYRAAHVRDLFLENFFTPDSEGTAEEEAEECAEEASKDEDEMLPFHIWANEINSYFPDWQKGLWPQELEQQVCSQGSLTFKVSLNKDVWRRIAMPAQCTFADLAMFIIHAFKFGSDHLYQFIYQDEYGVKRLLDDHRGDDCMDEFADAVELGETNLAPRQKIEFSYDFGDNWRFQVLVEKVDQTAVLDQPAVVESYGKAPKQYGGI